MTDVGSIEGCAIYREDLPALRLEWQATMRIDCDGSGGNPDNDPYYSDDTTLHQSGRPLNAYQVPFIVVPPMVIFAVGPVVMGCMTLVVNLQNGRSTPAVVGDQGPHNKIGEASSECARRLGLESNPNYGGTDYRIIRYVIWPGIAAYVDDEQYKLKPSR